MQYIQKDLYGKATPYRSCRFMSNQKHAPQGAQHAVDFDRTDRRRLPVPTTPLEYMSKYTRSRRSWQEEFGNPVLLHKKRGAFVRNPSTKRGGRGRIAAAASTERKANCIVQSAFYTCHCQSRISGISWPYSWMYCLCSTSLSFISCTRWALLPFNWGR